MDIVSASGKEYHIAEKFRPEIGVPAKKAMEEAEHSGVASRFSNAEVFGTGIIPTGWLLFCIHASRTGRI